MNRDQKAEGSRLCPSGQTRAPASVIVVRRTGEVKLGGGRLLRSVERDKCPILRPSNVASKLNSRAKWRRPSEKNASRSAAASKRIAAARNRPARRLNRSARWRGMPGRSPSVIGKSSSRSDKSGKRFGTSPKKHGGPPRTPVTPQLRRWQPPPPH